MAFFKCIACPFECNDVSICGKFLVPRVKLSTKKIEELGFYHVYPGAYVLFVETFSCNLGCKDCLYPHIFTKGLFEVQESIEGDVIILSCNSGKNYELLDKIKVRKALGLITHGFLNQEILKKYVEKTDFFMIVFFGFSKDSYAHLTISRSALKYAKEATKFLVKNDKFLEIRYVVVEHVNDGKDELKAFFEWILNLDDSIPVHIKRFYSLESKRAPTRNEKLFLAYKIAREIGLKYVYIDDLFKHEAKNTYYGGKLVIERIGDETRIISPELLEKIPIYGEIRNYGGIIT